MSEQVEVAGWINRPDTYEPYLSLTRDTHTSVFSEPLMTVAQHKRISDVLRERIESLEAECERLRKENEESVIVIKDEIIRSGERNAKLRKERDALSTELAAIKSQDSP